MTVVDVEIIPEGPGPAPGSEGAEATEERDGGAEAGTPPDDFGDNVELF